MDLFEALELHQEKLFWTLFVIIGALLITGILAGVALLEIPTGLMLIILGVNRLAEELDIRKSRRNHDNLHANIQNIRHLVHTTHATVKNLKTRHEARFQNINQRRILTDRKVEQNYRDLVRKILEIENDLTDMKRALNRASK